MATNLLLGEFRRTLDERYRVSLPPEFVEPLASQTGEVVLAKEREGALSLWSTSTWHAETETGEQVVRAKMAAGTFKGRTAELQRLGRLLSTRHRRVRLAGRGRLSIPEGFREFLGSEPSSDVFLVGAAVCIEIWRADAWWSYLKETMPHFQELFEQATS